VEGGVGRSPVVEAALVHSLEGVDHLHFIVVALVVLGDGVLAFYRGEAAGKLLIGFLLAVGLAHQGFDGGLILPTLLLEHGEFPLHLLDSDHDDFIGDGALVGPDLEDGCQIGNDPQASDEEGMSVPADPEAQSVAQHDDAHEVGDDCDGARAPLLALLDQLPDEFQRLRVAFHHLLTHLIQFLKDLLLHLSLLIPNEDALEHLDGVLGEGEGIPDSLPFDILEDRLPDHSYIHKPDDVV